MSAFEIGYAIGKIFFWPLVILAIYIVYFFLRKIIFNEPLFTFEIPPTDEEIRKEIEDTDLFRGLRECQRTGVYTGIYRNYDEIVAENKKNAEVNRADGCDYCVKCAYCEKYERCTKIKR